MYKRILSAVCLLFTLATINVFAIELVDGVYQIGTAQDLRDFATGINKGTITANANAVLTDSIDLENEVFPGIGLTSATAYKGTFDGKGFTIKGYKYEMESGSNGQGMFYYTAANAVIKDFTLKGQMLFDNGTNKPAFIGSVVGSATSTTIQDVTSSVTFTFTDKCVGTSGSGIRIVGGIVGSANGCTINRCRYNGTMSLNASTTAIGDRFAGIVGDVRNNLVTISNCLFDGTIQSEKSTIAIGGILGKAENKAPDITNCLSVGTLDLKNTDTSHGMVVGLINNSYKPNVSNTYYTINKFLVNNQAVATNAANKYNETGTLTDGSNWTALTSTLNGGVDVVNCNWKIVEGQAYPIPMQWENKHTHEWDANGFCTANDGAYNAIGDLVSGYYEITNGGQLMDFVKKINDGTIPCSSNARLTADINLSDNEFPGIGAYSADQAKAYTGTFDGNGKSISGYNRKITSGNQGGFFNYAYNATIKDFTLEGNMTVEGTGQQHGSVIGWADGTTLVQDVHSAVNVTISSTAAQVGGFAGRAGGTFNRCRFSGTVSSNTAYDKIGGFAGSLRNGTMQNCLFDGTLTLNADNANLKAGGFAGAIIEQASTMENCLANGTISIAHKTDACGIVVGLVDRGLNADKTFYTTTNTNGLTKDFGTITTNYKVTGVAKNVTGESWSNINTLLNPTEGTKGNWQIAGGILYPVPAYCDFTHQHIYRNGFCISEDGNYEAAPQDVYGHYDISNGGQLWWIATQLNNGSLPKNTRIKLVADIDMEGDAHGIFPGICPLKTKVVEDKAVDDWSTAFQGIFNGQGHDIRNYYRSLSSGLRLGLINAAHNATIRGFKLYGELVLTGGPTEAALIGTAIGSAHNGTTVEDINSYVDITTANARGVGGVVGVLEDQLQKASVTMNRCRYKGTITLTGDTKNEGIGGVVGELRSAVIKNCLFDGTIQAASGVKYTYVGGLVGKVGTSDNSEIHRCLVHGTISLAEYTAETNQSGVVAGFVNRTLYLNKCFHTKANTGSLPDIGPSTVNKTTKDEEGATHTDEVNLVMGESSDLTANPDFLFKPEFRALLGEPNWAAVASGYTYPLKDTEHIHKYSNGFCTAGDGEYEKPNSMGNIYQIDNGGKLYWFAEHFNEGLIDSTAIVEIMKDIDLEGDKYIYPGIGSITRKFQGQFRGYAHKISGFQRDIVNNEHTGLINYAMNAQIKNFTLEGNIRYNLATIKSFHGTVVGFALGEKTLIEDVTSSVNAWCQNENTRVLGGIAGRCAGIINKCRYNGTIAKLAGNDTIAMTSGRQIGGICANAVNKLIIKNSIFDGRIWCVSNDTIMRVCGILASNEKDSSIPIEIQNCIFNGCLQLSHNYNGANKYTQNGIFAGYWDTGKAAKFNNMFYLRCEHMNDLVVGTFNTTPTGIDNVKQVTSRADWEAALELLNEADSDAWRMSSDADDAYPVPNTNACSHTYDENGYCKYCRARKPLQIDDDNKFKMTQIADLASFRDLVNSGTVDAGTVLNAKLTGDIDFSTFGGDLGEPIGNSYFNRYLYNFDGQGYTIRNVKITSDDELIGFFGFAGDETHDCYIHDFTIEGTIEVPYDSKKNEDRPLCMGVIGKMFRGRIENVHSKLVMKNTNPTRANIGGILGCAETTSDDCAVVISNCSYTGTCYANAAGNLGGILGMASKNTEVKDCTFSGNLIHTYQGVNNTTQFGGVVGYNEEISFKGVKNCVIAGILKTDDNREFGDYSEQGNHKNILCGKDSIIIAKEKLMSAENYSAYKAQYTGNYALNVYKVKIPKDSEVEPEYYEAQQFVNGELCAIMNANGKERGQILGYQLKADLTQGAHTEGSPANKAPMPGYQNPEKKTYKVVKDASNNYTIDYLYLDDLGDATPLPSDAASIKAKKIEYTRSGSYMTNGFVSVCMPFALTADMLPGGENCLVKVFDQVKEENGANYVYFKDYQVSEDPEVKFPVAAGTPVFFYLPESIRNAETKPNWTICLEDSVNGYVIVKEPANPAEGGILGSFNTIKTGVWVVDNQLYKLNSAGNKMLRTTASSSCYPYRAYLKIPASQSNQAGEYRLSFENLENETGVSTVLNESQTAPRYNLMGQRVGRDAKGMIIRNGKICIVK